MNLLDRYVSRQVLGTSLMAVSVLSVVLVLGNLFKSLSDLLLSRSLPIEAVLTVVACVLPFSLTFTLPWGFLTSILLVFGRMSAESELTALRSSGISILRIARPVFAFGIAFSALCLWINADIAPRAKSHMRTLLMDIAASNPASLFRSGSIVDQFPGHRIFVAKAEGNRLENLLVYKLNAQNDPEKIIFAESGEIRADIAQQRLVLKLQNVRYEQRSDKNPAALSEIKQGITAEQTSLYISLDEKKYGKRKVTKVSDLAAGDLLRRIRLKHDPDQPETRYTTKQLAEMKTDLNKRFSFAMASLTFALVAVPLGITSQRKETSIGFMLSLAVAFAYFFLIIVAEWTKSQPRLHPELLIWVPNLVFLAVGATLLRRLAKR
jgi:lipopolysaccharide export system permease protein